jgi:hypothetical protein
MSNNKKIISFRDEDSIIEYLSARASQTGVSKSDVLRILVRERQAADSADAIEKYRKLR